MSIQSPYEKGQEVSVIALRRVFDGTATGKHKWVNRELFVEVDIAGVIDFHADKDVWLLYPVEVIEEEE